MEEQSRRLGEKAGKSIRVDSPEERPAPAHPTLGDFAGNVLKSPPQASRVMTRSQARQSNIDLEETVANVPMLLQQ